MFLPLLAIVMVDTDMAELVKDGVYGRVSPPKDLEIGVVAGSRRHALAG